MRAWFKDWSGCLACFILLAIFGCGALTLVGVGGYVLYTDAQENNKPVVQTTTEEQPIVSAPPVIIQNSGGSDDTTVTTQTQLGLAQFSLGQPVSTWSQGVWSVQEYDLANDPIIKGWLQRLRNPAPELWQVFPNQPNPLVPEFPVVTCADNPEKLCVPWGMEYGTYDTPYCWQSPCDVPVGAWEFRYISGDYQFLDLQCKGDMKTGCMLVILNEMDQSYTWRSQYVDNGFTLRGRYFDGDHLEWGVWGLISHGAANMLNMPTISLPGEMLNTDTPGNSGANCGTPNGCGSVDINIVVTAGDRVLAIAHTIVSRP